MVGGSLVLRRSRQSPGIMTYKAAMTAKAERGVSLRFFAGLLLILAGATIRAPAALAHGERSQEPSLRLSTIQWYDTTWSAQQVSVNQELIVSGRFHVMSNWP